jgi:hypothetical protein
MLIKLVKDIIKIFIYKASQLGNGNKISSGLGFLASHTAMAMEILV